MNDFEDCLRDPVPRAPRPLNILWISLEDTTPRFGCYGDPVARTPNLDKLASEGTIFRNAFSTAGVCAPSRVSIITGMYAPSIGAQHMRTGTSSPNSPGMPGPYEAIPPHYVKCFTEYLRMAGYYCSNCGKTDYQFSSPVTAWDDNTAQAHWRNRKPGQPFFSVFNLNDSHEWMSWDPDDWHDQPDDTTETDPNALQLPPYFPDTPKVRKSLARQYDRIAQNDRKLGQLLAQLEEDGLAEDTAIFIWSDHGEGFPRAKRYLYDTGTRIPLIVRWPGQVPAGEVTDQVVSLIDLGPTILGMVGLPIPQHLQGQAFLGPKAEPREIAFAARDRMDQSYDMSRSARNKRFKYIRNYNPEQTHVPWETFRNRHPVLQEIWRLAAEGELTEAQSWLFEPRAAEELYDVEQDPWERHNLAENPEYQEELAKLRTAMNEWQRDIGDLGLMSEDEMVERFWPNKRQPVTAIPSVIPVGPHATGRSTISDDVVLKGPVILQFQCSTQGASIAWRDDRHPANEWRIYDHRPIRVKPGTVLKLRLKAIRYGYRESKQNRVRIRVE